MQHAATPINQLTEKQLKAIRLLVDGHNLAEVARQIGVDRSTVHRWSNDNEAFVTEYDKQRLEAQVQSDAHLRRFQAQALETILRLMTDDKAPAATRLRAASLILEFTRDVSKPGDTRVVTKYENGWTPLADEDLERVLREIGETKR